jgi:cold shock CspA family protein
LASFQKADCMNTPNMSAATRLIAKLLAHRATPVDEVAGLIRDVHGAVTRLQEPAARSEKPSPPAATPRPPRRRDAAQPAVTPAEPPSPVAPAPASKLVRRAQMPAATPTPPLSPATASGRIRGIVKWFDPRAGKGALRLPGFAGDIALDAGLLAQSGIGRLFKGQEVDATFAKAAGAPQLERLALPGAAAGPVAGFVRSRRAKPVIVELKREAMRRVAARTEAEHLLGPSRSR